MAVHFLRLPSVGKLHTKMALAQNLALLFTAISMILTRLPNLFLIKHVR